MIDMKALESSLQGILNIGVGEATFEINGVKMTIRVLKPHEELDVQKTAYDVIRNSKESDAITTMEYLDKFRLNTLATAIVEINDQSFRDVALIETGETLPNGKKVQIPKVDALKKVLASFNRTILVAIFKKYTELVEKTEIESEKYVEIDVEELDSEIERLQSRIEELKKSKEERQRKEDTIVQSQLKTASSLSGVSLKKMPEPEPEPEPEETSDLDFEKEVEMENRRLFEQKMGKPSGG
jgi:hypothetical protein